MNIGNIPVGLPKAFLNELTELINKHSIENVADMPDFIMSDMICRMIEAMGASIKRTLDWHGCDSICHPSPKDELSSVSAPPPPMTCSEECVYCREMVSDEDYTRHLWEIHGLGTPPNAITPSNTEE